MYLTALTDRQCEVVRQWRNEDISMYRTSFYLTKEMQEDFYKNVVCNRNSNHRYYGVRDENEFFIGMVGLTNISLENRNAELSIVIDPQLRGQGYGAKVLHLLLDEGFNNVNLENIYGECYKCSPALDFWNKICNEKVIDLQILPNRKFYNGKYFDSIYFNFNRRDLE